MNSALLLILAGTLYMPGAADKDTARAKPTGTWEHSIGDTKVTFVFGAESLKVVVSAGGATVNLDGDYGVTRDGVLFGIVTKVVKAGTNDGPVENDMFRFRFTMTKDKLTIKDLHPGSDDVKAVMEGDYKPKKE